jgi:hypothetical protein
MSLSRTTLSHRRSSAEYPDSCCTRYTIRDTLCFLVPAYFVIHFAKTLPFQVTSIPFSLPTTVPPVWPQPSACPAVLSSASNLRRHRHCSRFSFFLSSASNPKSHLKQPFLNYVSDLPDSNLSFPHSLLANATTSHELLLPHPFPITICT